MKFRTPWVFSQYLIKLFGEGCCELSGQYSDVWIIVLHQIPHTEEQPKLTYEYGHTLGWH
jgi:hypothetical protein